MRCPSSCLERSSWSFPLGPSEWVKFASRGDRPSARATRKAWVVRDSSVRRRGPRWDLGYLEAWRRGGVSSCSGATPRVFEARPSPLLSLSSMPSLAPPALSAEHPAVCRAQTRAHARVDGGVQDAQHRGQGPHRPERVYLPGGRVLHGCPDCPAREVRPGFAGGVSTPWFLVSVCVAGDTKGVSPSRECDARVTLVAISLTRWRDEDRGL